MKEQATAIKELDDMTTPLSDNYFNLQGHRLIHSQLKPGLYIKQGRKIMLR